MSVVGTNSPKDENVSKVKVSSEKYMYLKTYYDDFYKKEKNEKVKLSSNYDKITGFFCPVTTDRSSKLPFLNAF